MPPGQGINEAAHSASVFPKEHGSVLCSPATPPELRTVPSRVHQGFIPQYGYFLLTAGNNALQQVCWAFTFPLSYQTQAVSDSSQLLFPFCTLAGSLSITPNVWPSHGWGRGWKWSLALAAPLHAHLAPKSALFSPALAGLCRTKREGSPVRTHPGHPPLKCWQV